MACDLGKREPECAAVTPSHAAMRNPVPSRNVQLDFIRNVDRIGDDDPSAFVGGVENEARHRVATVIEIDPTVQALRMTYGLATLLHFYLQASARPPLSHITPTDIEGSLAPPSHFSPNDRQMR